MRISPVNMVSYSSNLRKVQRNHLSEKPQETAKEIKQPVFKGWIKAGIGATGGALIGLALGGPIGAAVGAALVGSIGAVQSDKEETDEWRTERNNYD